MPSLSSWATVDLGRVGDDLTQGACQARGKPLGGFRAGGWGVGMWDVVGGGQGWGARSAQEKNDNIKELDPRPVLILAPHPNRE